MVALPATAGAVLSGTNGRIVFTSARDPFTTDTSQLYLRPTFSGVGGPGGVDLITPTSTTQRRHATWSPDRTMIAFAQGDSATSNFDIFVLDLTDPGATPQNITNSNNVTDDRPAWSPDGTRIAWESEVMDASGQQDILVDAAPFGSVNLNLTNNGSVVSDGKPAGKPAWSPDSQTVYYSVGDVIIPPNGTNNDVQIYQEPADNTGTATPVVHVSGAHAFQPSISPDGTRICYTASAVAGLNTNAVVIVASLSPGGGSTVLAASGAGDYNCTWSPDGVFIAYVDGTFTSGDLFMERSDNSSLSPLFLETTANRFDGNPDWAPDGRPQCQDTTVTTQVNTPVSIPLQCQDTGPAYERTSVRALVLNGSGPTQGSVSTTDPQTLPASITYTPNPGFLGTDSFKVRSIDEVAFGDRDGTVTVNVQPAPAQQTPRVLCAGKVSTIVGTGGADTITGTPRADVISSLGGNDQVKAGGGNDVVCGGPGKDNLKGGPGKDTLLGQGGKDTLKGGQGKDTCKGGKGKDTASACEVRKSI